MKLKHCNETNTGNVITQLILWLLYYYYSLKFDNIIDKLW